MRRTFPSVFDAAAGARRRPPETHNDRKKLTMSCCCETDRLMKKLNDGPLASEPLLLCERIAETRSDVRPSCRKKMRWPRPHSGAVRNSSPRAAPCRTLSASPGPIACSARSENRLASLLLSAATVVVPVRSVGVWQRAHPTELNSWRPREIDVELPGEVVDGVGGARKRMKNANFSTALTVSVGNGPSTFVT